METTTGATVLGFSYDTSIGDGESVTTYMLAAKGKGNKFNYRIFTDKKKYDKAVNYLNKIKKRDYEDED